MIFILFSLVLIQASESIVITRDVIFRYRNNISLDCSIPNDNITFYQYNKTTNFTRALISNENRYSISKYNNSNSTGSILHITDLIKNEVLAGYFCNNTDGDTVFFNELVVPHLYYTDAMTVTSTEGLNVNLTCHLLVAPYDEAVNWTWVFTPLNLPAHLNVIEENERFKIINIGNFNSTLAISNLNAKDTGKYYCTAHNDYGSHVRNMTLRVKSRLSPVWPFLGVVGEFSIMAIIIGAYEYTRKKSNNNSDPQIVSPEGDEDEASSQTEEVLFNYGKPLTLICNISSPVKFYVNNTEASASKYEINSTTLTIKSLRKDDIKASYFCNNSLGDKIIFEKNISPFLFKFDFMSNFGISGNPVSLSCYLLIGSENNESIEWQWKFQNGEVIGSDERFKIENKITNSTLTILRSDSKDSGSYECYAFNSYGNHSRNTKLVIKSNLAPLWPFLGTIGQFLILVLILLYYEINVKKSIKLFKRQKTSPILMSDTSSMSSNSNSSETNLFRKNSK
ncbi:unnamed protein product [Brachionus calyciflorus]|uniref:Ig-like domain-containing protein n=1 Tax=Brachionus calyciflorus TaxID=104777 RepID=A0A813TS41_9BILA|nr:unnamed protein product [Brachionus calyciflorus]